MKAVFGVLSLVIVLAVIAMIAKTQLAQVARVAPPGGSAGPAVAPARALGEQVRASAVQALQQGAERNQRADP
jgi:hypothetical protein